MKRTPDGLELNLEAAYDDAAGIRELKREFVLGKDGLQLTDEIRLQNAQEITWIFLLRQRPVWKNHQILSGKMAIRCPEGLAFSAEEKPVTDPRMARSWPGSLWRVRLQSGKTDEISAAFIFTAAEREA